MRAGPWFRWDGPDLVLRVQVQPRASRDGLAGVAGDCLKVRVAAPPVEGAANERLTAFLAELFGVPKRRVNLLHGQGGRHKLVRISAPRQVPADLNLPNAAVNPPHCV